MCLLIAMHEPLERWCRSGGMEGGGGRCVIGGVHLVIAHPTDLWTVEYYTARRDDEEDENIYRSALSHKPSILYISRQPTLELYIRPLDDSCHSSHIY